MLKNLFSMTLLRIKLEFRKAILRAKLRTAMIYAYSEQKTAEQASRNAQYYKLEAGIIKYKLEDLA